MRAPYPPANAALVAAQIEASPAFARVRELRNSFAAATPDIVAAILEEASRFADARLGPFNDIADGEGCGLVEGRVRTAPGQREIWRAFVDGGWGTLDLPEEWGGQALPTALAAAVQEIFDRACPAFGMASVPQRSAAKLIAAHGDDTIKSEWLAKLVSGEWSATICISEPEAGSDVGRIRTLATPNDDGTWSVTGEKCWISFGDHDLAPRIGHCLLARTPDAAPAGAGLSLFLVPDTIVDTNGSTIRNQIFVRRIEEKMGLHGSPTCSLGFEGARARLIGVEGRGLAQMFVMITNMRLSVGVQGVGIAAGCADISLGYAEERRQGGPVEAPVAIAEHADVQRMLLAMVARVETMRGLALALANYTDLAAHEPDDEARTDAAALVAWLLPIVKTTGGEIAIEVADTAIQVLGGAGYTREWPVEQALRDARVLTIFEGTTGIQGIDLVNRRLLRGDRRGLDVFLREARSSIEPGRVPETGRYAECLDRLDEAAAWLLDHERRQDDRDAGATHFLRLAALAATGWIAARLAALDAERPIEARLVAAARYWLSDIDDRAALLAAQAKRGMDPLSLFGAVRACRRT